MMRAVAIIVLGLSLLCGPAFPDELEAGWGPWAFNVGSWVMIRTTRTIGSMKSVTENTQTLVSVARDGAFKIKYVSKFEGLDPDERTQEFPAPGPTTLAGLPPIDSTMDPKPPGGVPPMPLPSIKGGRRKQIGKETLTVQGKEFPCTITESTMEMMGTKFCIRTWCEESGLCLKMESQVTGGIERSSKDLVTKIGEKVRIGSKEVCCIVRHSTDTTTRKNADGRQITTSSDSTKWFSSDVPGGMVRFEGRSNDGSATITEVVAFEARRK